MSVAPTACPVDPPTTGTLNIMMTNENAAPSASSGICLALSVFFTLTAATAQIGIDRRVEDRVGLRSQIPVGDVHGAPLSRS